MYFAFLQGRSDKDPSESWFEGEIWFYDNYVIPLAGKLRECGVFGVSCDEYLNYAQQNRFEWERKGRDMVAEMKARAVKDAKQKGLVVEMETVEEVENSSVDGESQEERTQSVSRAEKAVCEKPSISERTNAFESVKSVNVSTPPSKVNSPSPKAADIAELPVTAPGRTVMVPPGKLGITIDTSRGTPVIYSVDPDSPVIGKLNPGDVVLAVDDVETSSMVASAIADLIAAKAAHERRFLVQIGIPFRRMSMK
jgi:hypothetical protein